MQVRRTINTSAAAQLHVQHVDTDRSAMTWDGLGPAAAPATWVLGMRLEPTEGYAECVLLLLLPLLLSPCR
jgi:hypothetical protein